MTPGAVDGCFHAWQKCGTGNEARGAGCYYLAAHYYSCSMALQELVLIISIAGGWREAIFIDYAGHYRFTIYA